MPTSGDKTTTREDDRARDQKLERALDREFPVICFAWDGTAVARRDADASAVRSRVERLTALGRRHRRHQQRRRRRRRRAAARAPGRRGPPLPLSVARLRGLRGRARPARACSSAARPPRSRRSSWPPRPRPLRERLTAAGLDVALVRDHLNRRSVDLVPGLAASRRGRRSPSCSGEVDERLRDAGFGGGLHGVHGAGARAGPRGRPRVPGGHQRRPAHRHRPHRQERRHARGDARAGHGPRPPAAGPARARRHLRPRRRRRRAPTRRCSSPSCAAPCTSASARSRPACRRRCCTPAAARSSSSTSCTTSWPCVRSSRSGASPSRRPTRPGGSRSRASTRSASARSRRGSRSPTARPARAARSRRARRSRRRPPSSPASTATGPATRPSASRSRRPTGPACGSWWPAAR